MQRWTPFPHRSLFSFDRKSVRRHWARLHASDQEPLPQNAELLDAWALFHNGAFEAAFNAGCALGLSGATVANRACCTYAAHIERDAAVRLQLYLEVAERAAAQLQYAPDNANAHYLQAFALDRYSQGISVAKAMAQGLGNTVKNALEAAVQLQPQHAEACIALGTFHAEMIDKVGVLIGNMAFGAKRERSFKMFAQALALQPESPLGLVEYALALVILDGDQRRSEAEKLCAQAAAVQAKDALDWFHVEAAKAGLPPESGLRSGAATLWP